MSTSIAISTTPVAAPGTIILAVDNPIVVATIIPTGTPSLKCQASGYICKDGFGVSVAAITAPTAGATIPDPGPYDETITSSATKVKADGDLVLLEGDETGTINATPKIPSSPNPIDFPVSFKIYISSAGQIKTKAV